LEDWFFSGAHGRDVMSLDTSGQGACLPPLVTNLKETWPSEGILTKRLTTLMGPAKTAEAFAAHRHSFIGDSDLEDMASSGISIVRVPLTWAAFADALAPIDEKTFAGHNPDTDTVIVPDPFYVDDAAFATVPRNWLVDFLRRANSQNLTILFDLHAFPGGSSDGTYNGVWPNKPAFWQHNAKLGNRSVSLSQAGLWVAKALISWVESLDEQEQSAVAGVTLMNEPAHLAAIDTPTFASESDVLAWLAASSDIFRNSSLPQKGKKLYVQIIETAFKNFGGTVIPWWNRTFSETEQKSWAVIDRHWYAAWSNTCSGQVTEGGGYLCDQPIPEIRKVLRGCVHSFTDSFAKDFKGQKACTEFSVGTLAKAVLACNDPSVLNAFLEEQVSALEAAQIDGFFWTWRMPHGPVFEPGWSLKHLLGLEYPRIPEQCFPVVPEDPTPPSASVRVGFGVVSSVAVAAAVVLRQL
jgi:hypothetical protein